MTPETSLLSLDPAANPLLGVAVRPDVPVTWLWVLGATLVALVLIGAWTDLFRGKIVPNAIGWIGIPTSLALAPVLFTNWQVHLIAAAIGLLIFGAGAAFGGVGLGDVKVYLILLLALGGLGIWVVMVSQVLALAIGGSLMLIRRRKFAIPMLPFILGALLMGLWFAGVATSAMALATAICALCLAVGFLQSRLHPLPGLAGLVDEHLTGPGTCVRIGAGAAYRTDPSGEVTIHRAPSELIIAAAVSRLLDQDQMRELDTTGLLVLPHAIGDDRVPVTVMTFGGQYVLEASRPLGDDASPDEVIADLCMDDGCGCGGCAPAAPREPSVRAADIAPAA